MVYGVLLPAMANIWVRLSVSVPTQDSRQARRGSGLYEETSLANYNTLVKKMEDCQQKQNTLLDCLETKKRVGVRVRRRGVTWRIVHMYNTTC
jgi:hypothetical protein